VETEFIIGPSLAVTIWVTCWYYYNWRCM